MGCKQSTMISYAEITDEDRKLIPTLFREINSAHHSRGVSYWLSSSFVKEGTVPFKIGVSCFSSGSIVGRNVHCGVRVRFKERVRSSRVGQAMSGYVPVQ